MSRFQKYRLKKKTEFQRLKRLEKLVEEYFPQIWEFFEILEETTITNFQQTGPTTGTGEEERPVTAVTNFDQTGPTASTGEEERPVTAVTNFDQTGPTASTGEERPVTAVTNFDQTEPTAGTREEETIDRLIEEVYQSKDTIFNIEDILDEIYDL